MVENIRRRLHGILAADVAGYSALMEADEDGTVRTLRGCRAVFDEIIENFGGRIIATAGDSVVAVFTSVLDAVECGIEAQKALATYHAGQPEKPLIQFRMGVNLGDLMITESDTLGTAINVAARLESIADPGSVFISEAVYRHIRDNPEIKVEDRGAFTVKNIAEPVHAYSVEALNGNEAAAEAGDGDNTKVSQGCDAILLTERGPYYLRFGASVDVGRGQKPESADVVIGFRRASKLGRQARLHLTKEGIGVADCGSTNGTFVNSSAVPEGGETVVRFAETPAELCLGGIRVPPVKGPCRFLVEPIRVDDAAMRIRLLPETKRHVGEEAMQAEWPHSDRDFAATWVVATGAFTIGSGGECVIDLPDLANEGARARLAPNFRGFTLTPMNGADLTIDGHAIREQTNITDGSQITLDGVSLQFRVI